MCLALALVIAGAAASTSNLTAAQGAPVEASTAPASTAPWISVTVGDAGPFSHGNTITVSGTVRETLDPPYGITISIHLPPEGDEATTIPAPQGHRAPALVKIGQVNPSEITDNSFSKTIKVGGPSWTRMGDYIIAAQYGSYNAQATFNYITGGTPMPTLPEPDPSTTLPLVEPPPPPPPIVTPPPTGTSRVLTIVTDAASYSRDDRITFSGTTQGTVAREVVSVVIEPPIGSSQIRSGLTTAINTFMLSPVDVGEAFNRAGIYTIKAFTNAQEASNAAALELQYENNRVTRYFETPLAVASIPPKFVEVGSTLTFTVVPTEPSYTGLTWSLDGSVPPGATISNTGVFKWTPTSLRNAQEESFQVRITATDGTQTAGATVMISVTSKKPGADLSAMRMSALGDGHRVYVGLGEEPAAGSPLRVYVEFTDTANRPTPDVNYGVTVEQRGSTLASISGAHDANADLDPIVVTTSPLRFGGSVDVTVEFGGSGRPGGELAGPVGNTIGFRQVRTVTPVTQANGPAPHLDRITISGVSVTDATGSVVTREPVGERILISSRITNNMDAAQDYAHIVQVDGPDGQTVALTWSSGTLRAGASTSPSSSWIPQDTGAHDVSVFVWESIDNPVPLSVQATSRLTVVERAATATPDPRFVPYMTQGDDPRTYVERYEADPAYKAWFDAGFPGLTIQQAAGLAPPAVAPAPAPAPVPVPDPDPDPRFVPYMTQGDDPQAYVDRYNSDPTYKAWFDSNFPGLTIRQAVGLEGAAPTPATGSHLTPGTTHVPPAGDRETDRDTVESHSDPAPQPATPRPVTARPAPNIDAALVGITFQISGGDVSRIAAGTGTSILVTMDADRGGALSLVIPRSTLDSRTNGSRGDDVPFAVLVNDEIADAAESSSMHSRTLVVDFYAGDGQVVEVIGSWIIGMPQTPEPQSLTIAVGSYTYTFGDTITVSGTVDPRIMGADVAIDVISPSGVRIHASQAYVDRFGSYTGSFIASSTWLNQHGAGTYTIRSSYEKGTTAETTVNLTNDPTSSIVYLSTDQSQYAIHDTVIISGMVSNPQLGSPTITVTSPNGMRVFHDSPSLDAYGSFTAYFTASDSQWDGTGTYSISASVPGHIKLSRVEFFYMLGDATALTDRSKYSYGDIVTVTGTLNNPPSGYPTVTVTSPTGSRIFHDNPSVNADGSFMTSFSASGAKWLGAGEYWLSVGYGLSHGIAFGIEFVGGAPHPLVVPPPPPLPDPSPNNSKVLTIVTDATSYLHNDRITFSGTTREAAGREIVSVVIEPPSGSSKIRSGLTSATNTFVLAPVHISDVFGRTGVYTIKAFTNAQGISDAATLKLQYDNDRVTHYSASPLLIAPIPRQTIEVGSTLTFVASPTDMSHMGLTWSLDEVVTPGATINNAGVFEWTPTSLRNAQGESYHVDIMATDGQQTATTTVMISVIPKTDPEPLVDLAIAPIPEQQVRLGSTLTFTARVTDASLTGVTWDLGSAWLDGSSISPSGTFEWTPADSDLTDPRGVTYTVFVRALHGSQTAATTVTILLLPRPVEDVPLAGIGPPLGDLEPSPTPPAAPPPQITVSGGQREHSFMVGESVRVSFSTNSTHASTVSASVASTVRGTGAMPVSMSDTHAVSVSPGMSTVSVGLGSYSAPTTLSVDLALSHGGALAGLASTTVYIVPDPSANRNEPAPPPPTPQVLPPEPDPPAAPQPEPPTAPVRQPEPPAQQPPPEPPAAPPAAQSEPPAAPPAQQQQETDPTTQQPTPPDPPAEPPTEQPPPGAPQDTSNQQTGAPPQETPGGFQDPDGGAQSIEDLLSGLG